MSVSRSCIRAFYWYRNQWPWMTLNGVMTADARYLCGSWASCLIFAKKTIDQLLRKCDKSEVQYPPLQEVRAPMPPYPRIPSRKWCLCSCRLHVERVDDDFCSRQPAADGDTDNFRVGVLSISRGEVRALRWWPVAGRRMWRRHSCPQVFSWRRSLATRLAPRSPQPYTSS